MKYLKRLARNVERRIIIPLVLGKKTYVAIVVRMNTTQQIRSIRTYLKGKNE
jgi:hypothetical protein